MIMLREAVTVFLLLFSLTTNAAFECDSGKPACLQYSDKVVSSDAVCFSSGTCGWDGFICKATYEEVVDEHNELLLENDRLRSQFNDLLTENQDLIDQYNELVERYNEFLKQ